MNYIEITNLPANEKYEVHIELTLYHRLKILCRPFVQGWLNWILSHVEHLQEPPMPGDKIYVSLPPVLEQIAIRIHCFESVFDSIAGDAENEFIGIDRLILRIESDELEWQPSAIPEDDELPF